MFEAQLNEAGILKKVLDAIKELLNEATFDCSETGLMLQAMDSSHVSLVSLNLRAEGFEKYRCDRNLSMGMNMASLAKVLKCANNDDVVTIKASDTADNVTFTFESKDGDRTSDFDLKLMNLDQEHLGIPETEYACAIDMDSGEWARIIRDLHQFGESIVIGCNKKGVSFSSTGDIGTANVKLVQSSKADDDKKSISIDLQEPCTLTFAARYLLSFTKAVGLSSRVSLSMSPEVPLVVEFKIESKGEELGNIRYYLAPKIEDEDQ